MYHIIAYDKILNNVEQYGYVVHKRVFRLLLSKHILYFGIHFMISTESAYNLNIKFNWKINDIGLIFLVLISLSDKYSFGY